MYPAASKVVETPEELLFAAAYKKINNSAPNSVAIKGFDITFDTILRMCQENGFADSVSKYKTAYVEMDATSDGHCRVLVDSWKLKNLNECVISTFAIVKEAKV